jgi:S-adenosylmethionine hydrolase
MIVLFTDFGASGPYMGQMRGVLHRADPRIPVVDLFADAPGEPRAAAYLLAAYAADFPPPAVFLCVVDPGVGGERPACALRIDGQWFVGPDNGLFNVLAMRAREVEWWDITWRPQRLSATFHGRDLFAPVAATIAGGGLPPGVRRDAGERIDRGWPQDDARILYFDHFGNAITGIAAARCEDRCFMVVRGRRLARARRFGEVPAGEAFWYANANGLVEIAVNRGSAREALGLAFGDPVTGED